MFKNQKQKGQEEEEVIVAYPEHPLLRKRFLFAIVLSVLFAIAAYLYSTSSKPPNIETTAKVCQSMNEILAQNAAWRGVKIEAQKAGSFSVNGTVETYLDAMSLWEYLSENFPYVDKLQNNIAVKEIKGTAP